MLNVFSPFYIAKEEKHFYNDNCYYMKLNAVYIPTCYSNIVKQFNVKEEKCILV
jgi:hypothetical protein